MMERWKGRAGAAESKVFFYRLIFGQGIWQGLAPAALSSTIVLRQREIHHATFNPFVFT
jgi:hypothetical protein